MSDTEFKTFQYTPINMDLIPEKHPLDPLTAEELITVADIIRKNGGGTLSSNIMFCACNLEEPTKEEVWAYDDALSKGLNPPNIERVAQLILYDRASHKTYEAYISLDRRCVNSLVFIPGVQPPFAAGEYEEMEQIVLKDLEVRKIIEDRGLDINKVMVETWSVGYFREEDNASRRLCRPLLYYRTNEHGNGYAQPLDNICPIVDMIEKKVLYVDDSGRSHIPLPSVDPLQEYAAKYKQEDFRKDIKPLLISQPEGPSFKVKGNFVYWQRLLLPHRFRFS